VAAAWGSGLLIGSARFSGAGGGALPVVCENLWVFDHRCGCGRCLVAAERGGCNLGVPRICSRFKDHGRCCLVLVSEPDLLCWPCSRGVLDLSAVSGGDHGPPSHCGPL